VAFVYVTHDQVHALALSQRIAVMQEGRIIQIDTPEAIYRQPATRFVAGFIGACNLLDGKVEGTANGCLEVNVDGLGTVHAEATEAVAAGSRGTIAIRPEQIQLRHRPAVWQALAQNGGGRSAALPGTIRDRLYQGDVTLYTIELSSGPRLQAMVANAVVGEAGQFRQGDSVEIAWPDVAGIFLCR